MSHRRSGVLVDDARRTDHGLQLRPDQVPVIRAKIPESVLWRLVDPCASECRAGCLDAAHDLVGVLLVNAESRCDLSATGWGVLVQGHDYILTIG